ncbi:MAG TPA: hypothetical protein VG034_28980 [Acidimicrobiia bacterium]|nr:hypothetical protein [Acidimicrobiia bacterium]
MIARIDRSLRVAQPMEEMVRWCRSAEARTCWPGTLQVRSQDDSLLYDVALQAPDLPGGTLTFEEQLGAVEGTGRLRHFESAQRWSGPSGQLGVAWTEYSFTSRGPSSLLLDFSMRFMVHTLTGQDASDRASFRRFIEQAVDRYLTYLVEYVSLFQVVDTAIELPVATDHLAEFLRSPESREYWPGVRAVSLEDDVLTYQCGLAVAGIPEETLIVRERLGPLEGKARDLHFETEEHWLWPGGEVLDAWITYRLTPAGRASTRVEMTVRFVTPGAVAGQKLNRERFDQAVERVVSRFLQNLAGAELPAAVSRSA